MNWQKSEIISYNDTRWMYKGHIEKTTREAEDWLQVKENVEWVKDYREAGS